MHVVEELLMLTNHVLTCVKHFACTASKNIEEAIASECVKKVKFNLAQHQQAQCLFVYIKSYKITHILPFMSNELHTLQPTT